LQKERYEADKQTQFSYTMLANLLPAWKRELAWLKFSPAQTLQQSLKDLERAYANFFAKRAEFPRFKRKGVHSLRELERLARLDLGCMWVSGGINHCSVARHPRAI